LRFNLLTLTPNTIYKLPLKFFFATIFLLSVVSFIESPVAAQNLKKDTKYANLISTRQAKISRLFLQYATAISNNTKTKKVTRFYNDFLNEVKQSGKEFDSMIVFKSDTAYKKAALSFIESYLTTLEDEYKNLPDKKKKAEGSYNAMKALITNNEIAYKKLEDANTALSATLIKFDSAALNKSGKLYESMEQQRTINAYDNLLYLIVFKPYLQETLVSKAIGDKDERSLKKHGDSLSKYAQDGLDIVDTVKFTKGISSMKRISKHTLKLYAKEAGKNIKEVSSYFSEENDFKKTRTEFVPNKAYTNLKEFKEYAVSVKKLNRAIKHFNKAMNEILKTEKYVMDKWRF
jgi:hypothetical protein